jgi:NADH:ubiquinone reductase (H+-translocating)
MSHRVVFLGAGYAGLPAAARLAGQVYTDEVEVLVLTESPAFVERPRLHQLATGQTLRDLPLERFLRRAGVRLRIGRAVSIDLARRSIDVLGPAGREQLGYGTLVYAPGSNIDLDGVPGVRCHARTVDGPAASRRIHEGLQRLHEVGGSVVVCGGGLTGIEVAAEIAESFPRLEVRLVSLREPGARLSERGRRYLRRTFDRLGVDVTAGHRVTEVRDRWLRLSDGSVVPFDLCVWAGGFTVPDLAAKAGLEVDDRDRVVTDRTLRSVSDANVYAIGDAAAVPGPWGSALAMGCRTGGFTGPAVADVIAARLAGKEPRAFGYRYIHECISLGRRRGLVQFLHRDESPAPRILTGQAAIAYKEMTLKAAVLLFRSPGPYLARRRHVAAETAAGGAAG